MTQDTRKAQVQQELARRELARRRLLQFVVQTHPSYQPGWVHDDICRRLERFSEQVAEKKSPRLMLLMPPRHGKSELASIRFPAWHLGKYAEHEIINVGYNLDLPMRWSRKIRELLRDPAYTALFPGTKLDQESQGLEAWLTTQGGGFTASGRGGGITGKGAHILIVDDPLKNQEEADSAITRDSLWDWYLSTAYTRLAPGGGVLVIECMTGDTPVRRPDGTETPLAVLVPGDEVATYEDGRLSTSTVRAVRSSGEDFLMKITTESGKVVRANGRHPFLVCTNGTLEWIRTRSLTTGHTIVALKDSGGSGPVKPVQQMDAASPQTSRGAPSTGRMHFASTTATKLARSGGCYVTNATSPSDSFELSGLHSPQLSSSDFILDRVVSVEPAGREEVFDVQIDRTENFIANGLVSHNTWWNDDDLAGRLQQAGLADEEADQFEVVKYPALAEQYEYRQRNSMEILRTQAVLTDGFLLGEAAVRKLADEVQVDEGFTDLSSWELLRQPGEALHKERYDEVALARIRAVQDARIWSALYQQNPVPDEGMYFKKEWLKTQASIPDPFQAYIYTAWDFAIGEKQTNDYTVGCTLLRDANDVLYVLDLVRARMDTFDIVESILDTYERWGHQPGSQYFLGFEDGQIWKSLEPVLQRRMVERKVYPAYEVLKPLTDKQVRARPLQGRLQQGRVVFPEEAPWRKDVEHELLRFPAGKHDDIVDAMAWAVRLTLGHEAPRKRLPQSMKTWREKLAAHRDIGEGSHLVA